MENPIKLWITPCRYDSIVLFQTASSVLSRCRGHSLDRYEEAIHPSGRLRCIQLSSGDHRSVYTSILSTHAHPLKTSHDREIFLCLLKKVSIPVMTMDLVLRMRFLLKRGGVSGDVSTGSKDSVHFCIVLSSNRYIEFLSLQRIFR